MKWSKYNYQWSDENNNLITYNSLHNTIISGKVDDYQNIEADSRKQLEEGGFIVGDVVDENVLMNNYIHKRNKATKSLSCWIFVSNDCNLACPYCWEKDGLLVAGSNMKEDIYKQVVSWVISKVNAKKMEELVITFMGGEPLLNLKAIEYIAMEIGATNIPTTFEIITNGVLLKEETIRTLKRLNIHSYQITLDGTAMVHNKRRKYKDGRGSFEEIVHNILLLINEDDKANIVIRINVDMENYKSIPYLLRMLKNLKFNKFVAICLNDTILEDDSHNEFILKQVISILKLAQSLEFRIAYGELNNCWMMSESWFMVNVDGLLYKCPSVVGNIDYAVGSIDSEQMYEAYDKQMSMTPWQQCLNCELVGLCSGGCPNRDIISERAGHCQKVCRKQYIKELLKLKYTSEVKKERDNNENTMG